MKHRQNLKLEVIIITVMGTLLEWKLQLDSC